MAPPLLKRGQIWHAQPPGTSIGAFGSTFFIQDIPALARGPTLKKYKSSDRPWKRFKSMQETASSTPNDLTCSPSPRQPLPTRTRYPTASSDVSTHETARQTRKDSRQIRDSIIIITSITQTPTRSLNILATRVASDSLSNSPLTFEIIVNHYHGPPWCKINLTIDSRR